MPVIQTPPDLFGMTTSGLEYGEVECWIRPAAYWFRVVPTSLAKMGLIQRDREVTGALHSVTEPRKASGGRNQNLSSTWRKRQENCREHHPAVRWLMGSSACRESQTKPRAYVVAVVPRHEERGALFRNCLLYTSPSPRDATLSRMPSSA